MNKSSQRSDKAHTLDWPGRAPTWLAVSCTMAMFFSGGTFAQPQSGRSRYVEAKTIALRQAFHTKRNWHVTAYKAVGDDAETGDLPVKICFWFDPSAEDKDCVAVGDREYPHQNLAEFGIVPLVSDPPLSGVLVNTFFSGGGSGIAREVSISTYDPENDVFSQLISLTLNEISEYRIFSSGTLAGSIVTASGLWQQDEGHSATTDFGFRCTSTANITENMRNLSVT
jgi:hypothetical protein